MFTRQCLQGFGAGFQVFTGENSKCSGVQSPMFTGLFCVFEVFTELRVEDGGGRFLGSSEQVNKLEAANGRGSEQVNGLNPVNSA